MRRLGLFGVVLLFCLLGFQMPASAHVLQSDGTIGAVLHIDPADDPVAGQPQNFILFFKDTTSRFSLARCTCGLQILAPNNQSVYSQALIPSSDEISQNPFTFTHANVYNLVVSGEPKQPGAFQSFKLTYIIRVERGTGDAGDASSPEQITLSLALGLLLLQALVLLGIYQLVHTRGRNHV